MSATPFEEVIRLPMVPDIDKGPARRRLARLHPHLRYLGKVGLSAEQHPNQDIQQAGRDWLAFLRGLTRFIGEGDPTIAQASGAQVFERRFDDRAAGLAAARMVLADTGDAYSRLSAEYVLQHGAEEPQPVTQVDLAMQHWGHPSFRADYARLAVEGAHPDNEVEVRMAVGSTTYRGIPHPDPSFDSGNFAALGDMFGKHPGLQVGLSKEIETV